MKRFLLALLISTLLIIIARKSNCQSKFSYPKFSKSEVVDTFYNKYIIPDPFRWLEYENTREVKSWINAQNNLSISYLNGIPFKSKLHQRIKELWNYEKWSTPKLEAGWYFTYKNNGLQDQSILYVSRTLNETGKLLIDPNTFSKDGSTSISNISISPNGKYIAYAINKSGSDWQEYEILEIESGKKLKDKLNWIKFGSIAWLETGFFYNAYSAPDKEKVFSSKNEINKIYYHKIGNSQQEDSLVFASPENPDWSYGVEISNDNRLLYIWISKSTSNNDLCIIDLQSNSKKILKVIEGFNSENVVLDNEDKNILLHTNHNAPNYKIVKIDIYNPEPKYWNTLVAENTSPLSNVAISKNNLYLHYLDTVKSKVTVHNREGKFLHNLKTPKNVIINLGDTDYENDILFYSYTSYLVPTTTAMYDHHKQSSTILYTPTIKNIDLSKFETRQIPYKSKDGTPCYMYITCKKDLNLDGNNPVLLYGYGGFNISILPDFVPHRLAFLEQGGIWVTATLRGGSEFGEKWHEAGMQEKKQNAFDDYISAAEYLITNNYTQASKLAIYGRSNGGLLVGAVMIQRPDLFRVALATVGVMDMLRYHKFTIGYYWAVEYGCVSADEHQFKNLLNYSPLHNIKPQRYPATLVLTGDHDDRVVPAHSYKYITTLQENQIGDLPCLIRIDINTGHGSGKSTNKLIAEWTDMYAFTMLHLGMRLNY